jgi:hypothetical protein
LPRRRELLADGQPIKLGGAFDMLMALIEAPRRSPSGALSKSRVVLLPL